MVAVLTTFAMTAVATRALPALLSSAAMRWRPGGAHPLSAHAVYDAVELFDDSIEAAGGIA